MDAMQKSDIKQITYKTVQYSSFVIAWDFFLPSIYLFIYCSTYTPPAPRGALGSLQHNQKQYNGKTRINILNTTTLKTRIRNLNTTALKTNIDQTLKHFQSMLPHTSQRSQKQWGREREAMKIETR